MSFLEPFLKFTLKKVLRDIKNNDFWQKNYYFCLRFFLAVSFSSSLAATSAS